MKKQTLLLTLIFGGLLVWLTLEYFDHRLAFEEERTVNAHVIRTTCRSMGGCAIGVFTNSREGSLEVTRADCDRLNVGDDVTVLQSEVTGKFYWNHKPGKGFLWLYLPVALMGAYQIYRSRKHQRVG